jgi:hypothetical protein
VNVRRCWFVSALVASLALSALPACDGFLSSSKVAQGQRYQSDDPHYDPYFDSVHQAQVAAAGWPDEKKAARKPLINVLALTPGAVDETIIFAIRERVRKPGGGGAKLDIASSHVTPGGATDAPLFAAVEETARLELDRARKLKDKADKCDEMLKHGELLKDGAEKEQTNRGAEKADEKKNEKNREIRRELGGAVDSMRSLTRDAAKQSKEAQEFLEDLAAAVEAKERGKSTRGETRPLPPAPAPKAEDKKPDDKKPDEKPSKPSKPSKPKPAEKPAEKPAGEKPAPAEKPAPKPAPPPDEGFNP